MPIKIPEGAKVARDSRLTLIRLLKTMSAEGGRLDELVAAVKRSMADKGVRYAESDAAIADLRPGGKPPKFADPRKLHALAQSGRITLNQFLAVICVRSSLLPQILSGDEIAALCPAAANDHTPGEEQPDSGALYTDFRPNTTIDWTAVETAMLDAAAKSGRKNRAA